MPAAIWAGRNAHPEKVAADIAAALGDELGLGEPPLAVTLSAESAGVPAGSLLPPRERFSGMPAPTRCYVYVDAPTPRAFELRASVMGGRSGIRRSLGLGHLLYAVPLAPRVPSHIELGLGAAPGSVPARFDGDTAVTDRLNRDARLLDLAHALTPATAGLDRQYTWQVACRLTIDPRPDGSVLFVQTLHRPTSRAWSLGAHAVLDFAARAETALV
ncbi:hypothetical protein FCH28_13110 [Streptomyces piniterrae]|uniref:Uncharacterized protein n=1 Tax=Streptomyces piniterrae TaxID=2571125 RepID=A0A4U0NIL9_9ACTN|nr:hypothetical protein [Streptomyces piniterrae]TJZ54131.1 hypothetical protein FCH28_13110 [Streptomyces piniterrae]